MTSKVLRITIISLFALLPPYLTLANESLSIVINEIAWMGTEVGWRDEWIELRNMTNRDIDISGWIIENASKNHGPLEIPQDGKHTIFSNSYYLISYYSKADNLLEPKTALDVIVDWRVKNMGIISFANNYKDNGQLRLKDNYGTLIDQTLSPTDNNWPAGDNKTKQTMERTNSGNWQTSQEPNGTPRTENSVREKLPIQSETELQLEPQPEPEPEEKTTLIIYPTGIIFNEILPSPEGPDSENEYIEIFNKNDFDVDLSDWKIRDSIGSVNTFNFPKNTMIKAQGYLIILRPETKIVLNNDADSLNLIQPDSAVADNVSYEKAKRGESYNLIGFNWIWSQEPTPGKANIIKTASDFGNKKVILKEKSTEIKQKNDLKELASAFNQVPENDNDFSDLFLMTLAIAIFSAVIILLLKKAMHKIDFWEKIS